MYLVLNCDRTCSETESIYVNERSNYTHTTKNGLPQGYHFVLMYNDALSAAPRKFTYADDLTLATQHQSLSEGSSQLTKDLEVMHKYYIQWYLKSNN